MTAPSANARAKRSFCSSESSKAIQRTSLQAAGDSAEVSEDSTGRRRTNYSVKKKRELIAHAQVAGLREVCRVEGIPRRTLRHWLRDAEKINSYEGPDTRKSIGRSGRRELLPFGRELSAFLEEGRRKGRDMTSAHMIDYIRQDHAPWLKCYMADKKSTESGHAALTRLCQRFVERHGLTDAGSGGSTSTRHEAATSTIHNSTPTPVASTPFKQARKPTSSFSRDTAAKQFDSSKLRPDDESPLLFGLDIGTTAIKCVVVQADGCKTVGTTNVSLTEVPVPARPGDDRVTKKSGVQNVGQVLFAVQHVVALLPETIRQRVTSIGICGQMHGIVWWCSRAVHEAAERLLTGGDTSPHVDEKLYEPAWSELITWQDQRCTASFLQKCRDTISCSNPTTNASESSRLAAGYGLASFAHVLEHSPRTLVGMDACGTIQDFVAFVLCGHTLPSETFMDTTNAHSWGGFSDATNTWDSKVLRALRIPSSMLPSVKKPGTRIGHTSTGSTCFGLPWNQPVYVPMGDHPCSVLAALSKRHSKLGKDLKLTLVNMGTSAQMAVILTATDIAKLSCSSETSSMLAKKQEALSFEVRPFLLDDYFLGVAASLSGGNLFAWLVQQWQHWAIEMGLVDSTANNDEEQTTQRETEVYARLIKLGLQCQDTQLTFVPTLNGERADPNATGSILNLQMNNWSMGDISAALSRGLVDNLFAMIPQELQALVSTQPVIGTGNALVKNDLLQQFLRRRLANPRQLHLQTAADAAVGASLAPLLENMSNVVLNA